MGSTRSMRRRTGACVVALLAVLSACGGGGSSDEAGDERTGTDAEAGASGEAIKLGYSAWPGWFPLAVAEKQGLFEKAGVKVELVYFADYLSSLDAMAAGKLDGNTQTLNDTLVSVSAGRNQQVVVVNDNSAGNDAIIVDKSIQKIADLKGKSVAAEQGVVDHFLLLQGLTQAGLSEKDIDFRGLATDAAAAAFASGQFDAVGVFAPFTVEALKRPGSHVLFDSADFPGSIPDFVVFDQDVVSQRRDDIQKIVDVWYETLDWIAENPDEARAIMAEKAGLDVESYEGLEKGTRIFSAEEALEAFMAKEAPVGLLAMAEQINKFLLDTGLAKKPAPLDDLLEPSFTSDYLKRNGG
ncbi:MAG: aliphatic sulfonates ABC transporter substrate-binding protein [Actinobacteria bacterium]|nr:MAG: aliphatic sulfonates ABC transporter substrate-binding protein [Actinomycetota bacterium]